MAIRSSDQQRSYVLVELARYGALLQTAGDFSLAEWVCGQQGQHPVGQ